IPVPRVSVFNGQSIVIAHIPPGMPHVYSLDGRYLARVGTENVPIKPRDLRRLIFERGELNFETEVPPGATLATIHVEMAEAYAAGLTGIGEADVRRVLMRRGCLVTQDGELRPPNAAILLFGKAPQRFVRGAEITAARFAGETMSDTFSRQ